MIHLRTFAWHFRDQHMTDLFSRKERIVKSPIPTISLITFVTARKDQLLPRDMAHSFRKVSFAKDGPLVGGL
jgi:hypothetical protein